MIKKKEKSSMIEIDLTGPEGNAFFLIGTAMKLARKIGFDAEAIKSEMMAGDYENLIKIFDSYFGSIVILYR